MRALAVIAVVVYHANPDWLKGGFLGVEMFFVISGYLITLLLISEQERTDRVNLGQFWIRRARRLLPALFLMMLLVTVYTAIFESDYLGTLRGDVFGGLLYVSNWFQIWVGAGYAAAGDFVPLRHLWSLAVEEQFYLVWPLFMLVFLRNGTRNITNIARWLFLVSILITLAVALLSYSGQVGTPEVTPDAYWTVGDRQISNPDLLYLSTLTRSSGLMLGAAFAMIWRPLAVMRGPLRHRGRLLDGVGVLGLLGMFVLMMTVGFIGPDGVDPFLFRGGMFLAGVATLATIAAVTHRHSVVARVISVPALMWVGTRSYGIYLYHWPIYQIIRGSAGVRLDWWEFALGMVLTAIVCELSFRFVETPIRRGTFLSGIRRASRGNESGQRGAVMVGAAVGTALAVFAGASLATAELKQSDVQVIIDEGKDSTCDVVNDPTCGSATDESIVGPPATTPAPTEGTGTATDGTVTGSAPPPTTTSTLPPAPIAKLALGDSVMLGASSQLVDLGFVVDAVESRQFSNGTEVVEALRDQGRLGDTVVVHLGTNGTIEPDDMTAMMTALADVPTVLLLTVDVEREWTAGNNALIYDTAATYPNVELLDWAGLSDACVGDCFAQSDGFHLADAGQDFYAQVIAEILEL
jgi:peptidoglycan/LPS O-acetylase OafA/YrhL